jgi:hypothetical protein
MPSSSITTMHTTPTTQTNANNRERKVRLNRRGCQTRLVESHHDFSEDEIESIWYSSDDYRRIRSKNQRLVRMIKDGYFAMEDDKHFCFRGIVNEQLRQKRVAYRQQALHSLRCEQQRQYMAGITDEDNLRSALVLSTRLATEEAMVRAQEDRRAVLDKLVEVPIRKVAAQEVSTLTSAFNKMNYNTPALPEQSRGPVCNNQALLVSILDETFALLVVV